VTLPYEFEADEPEGYEPNLAEAGSPAVVPVKVMFDENINVAPAFGSCQTWQITNAQPVQIIQRQYRRNKAKIWVPGAFGGATVFFNTKVEPLMGANPQGVQMAAFFVLEYEAQPALYAVASAAGPIAVCVLDMLYGQVQ